MKVTYLHHSGFSVELDNNVLVFDYYTENGLYNNFNPDDYKDKNITVFSSHIHSDHFDPCIKNWQNVHYVLSFDIPQFHHSRSLSVEANKTYTFNNLEIKTLLSNDEGVAFLVNVEGKNIYHSGDLNWWNWSHASDEYKTNIENTFKKEMSYLFDVNIDVAFIPMDIKLEKNTFLCCEYFNTHISTNYIFPMHFYNDFTVGERAKKLLPNANILAIEKKGHSFIL